MSDFKILLQAAIDQASKIAINNDIKSLKIDPLKIQVDKSNIISSIQKALKEAASSSKLKLPPIGSGKSGLSSTVSQYKSEYQQLMTIARQMSSTKIKIASLDTNKNKSEIDALSKQLSTLKSEYFSLSQSLSGKLSIAQWNNLQSVLDKTGNKIDALKAKMADTKARTSEGIRYKIDVGDYETQIARVQQQFVKWGMSTKEVETQMSSLKSAYLEMQSASTVDERIQAEKKYQKELQITKNDIIQMSTSKASSIQTKDLSNKIQTWLDKNTAASKEAKTALQAYLDQLNGEIPLTQFKSIQREFKNIEVEQRNLGNLGKSFSDSLKSGISKFKDWLGVSTIVMKGVQAAKDMYQAVYDIDTAMTELAKVSNASFSQLNSSLETSKKTAKECAASVSDVVNATADWSRLGYSLPESEELAKVATIYTNVGDGIDIDTANKSLVSTIQGYQLKADQALGVIDRFNEVANNFPIDSAGIGEALQRSAASFYAANTDLSKSIALITGTNSVVQDPDSVGKYIVPTFTVMCC